MAQCQKYSKTADEVEKKVTTFGENIHLEKFQPYGLQITPWYVCLENLDQADWCVPMPMYKRVDYGIKQTSGY